VQQDLQPVGAVREEEAAQELVAVYDTQPACATCPASFPKYVENGVWREMTTRPVLNGLTEYVLRTAKPLLVQVPRVLWNFVQPPIASRFPLFENASDRTVPCGNSS
jgi:hypothetical protein